MTRAATRRQGVGKNLVKRALEEASADGVREIIALEIHWHSASKRQYTFTVSKFKEVYILNPARPNYLLHKMYKVEAVCTMALSVFSQKIFVGLQFSPQVQSFLSSSSSQKVAISSLARWRLSSRTTGKRTKSSSTQTQWESTRGEFFSH